MFAGNAWLGFQAHVRYIQMEPAPKQDRPESSLSGQSGQNAGNQNNTGGSSEWQNEFQ